MQGGDCAQTERESGRLNNGCPAEVRPFAGSDQRRAHGKWLIAIALECRLFTSVGRSTVQWALWGVIQGVARNRLNTRHGCPHEFKQYTKILRQSAERITLP